MCNFRHQRVVWVWICEHRTDGKEDCLIYVSSRSYLTKLFQYIQRTFRYRQRRAPLISENVETDAAIAVDVWVVDAGCEVDLRRLEWVVCWEVDCEEEDAAGVWRVAWTHDGGLPVELWKTFVRDSSFGGVLEADGGAYEVIANRTGGAG